MAQTPKIGFTERGDGGLDLSWTTAVENKNVDGVIVVTKSCNPKLQKKLLNLHRQGYQTILHCGCTGWGKTWLEPNVPTTEQQLTWLKSLLDNGFPAERVVLRIDPIIPTREGLARMQKVLLLAKQYEILDNVRIRISIYDEYKHVKARLAKMGRTPFYPNGNFYAPYNMMRETLIAIDNVLDKPHTIETCAEELLSKAAKTVRLKNVTLERRGCLSPKDLEIMGLQDAPKTVNGQQRGGCLCLTCKRELLQNRKQCPHKCVYCYWRVDA